MPEVELKINNLTWLVRMLKSKFLNKFIGLLKNSIILKAKFKPKTNSKTPAGDVNCLNWIENI